MEYRKFILLTAFVLCGVLLSAQQVDYEKAKTIATSFIAAKKGNLQESHSAVYQQYTEYGNADVPLFYLFNFEEGGFVIVSADKNAEPILAYSTTGAFLMNGTNPAAENWVNAYAQGISYAMETQAVPTAEMIVKWEAAENGNFSTKTEKAAVVEPLLTSKWNQDRYYNTLCPDTITGGSYDNHTPNGCVALAMAQIMYYHRYPNNGIGATGYICTGYGPQQADYANANYNYDAMSDIATGYSNEIAKLCYHAGVSVKMNYKAEGSGASTDDAYSALAGRFAYKSTLGIYSGGGNNLTWKNLLKTDLNRGLPIYYSACTGGSGVHACHAFVCDGYDENDNFHFNWGWGGGGDGYFSLSNMMGFVLSNQIITGIEPFRETKKSIGADTLTATYGSFSDGSSPRVDYANNSDRSWLITPQNGKNVTRILLRTAYFATEKDKDIVNIYSGNKADADSIIATLSGSLDTSIVVNASQCFVTFRSDASGTARGFKFTYTSTRTSENLCPAQIPSLTNFYGESQGSITNNDGDGSYDDENTCYWAIKPQDNQKVGLRFTKFDLAEGDVVELYTWDGATNLNLLRYWTHGKYRFTKQKQPELNREYLISSVGAFVRFRTDNNLNAAGFELNWYTTNAVEEAQLGIASVQVFPNPTNDVLKIQIETTTPESIQLVINDIVGRTIYASQSVQPEQHYREDIDMRSFSKGVYVLKISTSKGSMTKKVVVK